tara:strand:- start:740 stop:1492 length:753 start_codon:yes stop_codon:yes gene_type:complete
MPNQYSLLNVNEEKISCDTHKSLKQLSKKLKYAKEHYYMTHSRKDLEKMEHIKLNIIKLRGIKSKYVNKDFVTYEMRNKKEDKMNKKRIIKEKRKRKIELQLKEKQKYYYYQKERETKNRTDIIRYDNLNRSRREFQSNKDLITKTFLSKLQKIYENIYIPRPIREYFYYWDSEKIYSIKMPAEYSLVGLKSIYNTIYTLFDKLPLDIIKIIWDFYYTPNYKKTGDIIRKFKKNIDNEKDIYNMRMKLYS